MLQHVVASFGGEPNGFSLIGRAIHHSWDGLCGRNLCLKRSRETGIQHSVDLGAKGGDQQ